MGRVGALLREELRQARSLVWTPLARLCRLERNAPLAVHAARLAQLGWELERRPGVRAAEEARRAASATWAGMLPAPHLPGPAAHQAAYDDASSVDLEAHCLAWRGAYTRGKGSA